MRTRRQVCEWCKVEFEPSSGRSQKFCSVKCRSLSRLKGQWKDCPVCKKKFYSPPYDLKRGWGTTCSHMCYKIYKRTVLCPPKPHVSSTGYMVIFDEKTKRMVQLHRVVMEKYLGRKLETWEVIHHLDGNKTNNELSNLSITVQNVHGKTTRSGKMNNVRCPHCQKEFKIEGYKNSIGG